jgi:hypothetical protein
MVSGEPPPREGRRLPAALRCERPPAPGVPRALLDGFRNSKTAQSARRLSLKVGNFQFSQEMLQEMLHLGACEGSARG